MPKLLRAFTLLLALLGGLPGKPAFAQTLPAGISAVTSVEGIDEYRLTNGLQVLLIPDDSKPTTTVNVTYRVGSRHESYGETGMAHLLEHMLFKGSPKNPQPKADFSTRGLNFNGTTSTDRTNYFASFSANDANLQWYIGWLADSMINSFVARKDLDTEMTVVRNEMESGENNPSRILWQRTMAAMFDWHNYGHSTIGARSDVENVDIPRLQAFYRTYYQPDNAVLTVSGKFDTAAVLKWVSESFAPIPKPARVLPLLYTLDPTQDGERSVTLRRIGGTPLLYAGYHVPASATPDFAAVELLELILGDVPAGRLHKRLTQAQLASSAFASAWELADPGVLVAGAQLAPGQDIDKARVELLATVESIRREPITADELARARLQWLNAWDKAFTNPESVGITLSGYIGRGDWRLLFQSRDWVRATQLADVQRVAEQYLVSENRTLGTYVPTDKPLRAPAPARVDMAQALQGFKPQAAAAKVEAFEATPANIDARTQLLSVGGIKAALLPKGTRGGAVQAVLTLHFGDETSLFNQSDVASAVAQLLNKGTKTLTREQVQDRLDQLQTDLGVSGSAGAVSVVMSSRREHLPAAIALVGDLLRNPVFPAAALEEYRRQVLSGIEQQRKEPRAVVGNTLARLGNPYPRGDVRYARTFDERTDDINRLNIDAVRAFHSRFYGAGKGEFAAVGDFDPAAVTAALQAALGDWNAGMPFTRIAQPLVAVAPQQLMLPTPDQQNANMLVRLALPMRELDPDYAALTMANHLLGAGSSSRLWKRVREADGLSYDVRSSVDWSSLDANSLWQGSAIFAPQNRARVETAFREELARARRDGFTSSELSEGQGSLLNFRKLSRAQDAGIASAWANNLYLGRTFAVSAKVDTALAALTLDQVNAALRKYVTPDAFVWGFAGDFKP